MPASHSNNNHNGRPLMPTLASTRTSKTPVTPRLAGTAAQSNTPTSRRSDRTDFIVSPSAKDELSTPVKPYVTSNITPRSTARKSRVGAGSTQSTPTGTPVGTPSSSRPTSLIDARQKDHLVGGNGLGVSSTFGSMTTGKSQSVVGSSSTSQKPATTKSPPSLISTSNSEILEKETRSKFFHANEAKLREAAPPFVKKQATFFYADGKKEATDGATNYPSGPYSPPLSAVAKAKEETQFFHANIVPHGQPETTISASSTMNSSPEVRPQPQFVPKPFALRPPSPEKNNIHLSYRKGASQVIKPRTGTLPFFQGSKQLHTSIDEHEKDGSRINKSPGPGVPRVAHGKSASLSSLDSVSSPPHRLQQVMEETTAFQQSSKLNVDITSRKSSAQYSTSSENSVASPGSSNILSATGIATSIPQSPVQNTFAQANSPSINELAANARRERKVLDLEISNSSLLAINRQLEREVRKQKAELRRYRRLSRAGRFSIATISSGAESTVEDDAESREFRNEISTDYEEDEDLSNSSSSDSADEEALSPAALAARDAQRIGRDEKRLQLDLSRHRELLIDSQKLNQSLKRCLGWTEELIKEGKKALEYKVRVSEVKMGGRVLTTEDIEHTEEEFSDMQRKGELRPRGGSLLAPWTPSEEKDEETLKMVMNLAATVGAMKTDRDSAIELGLPLAENVPLPPEHY
jgi:hypothetical protein